MVLNKEGDWLQLSSIRARSLVARAELKQRLEIHEQPDRMMMHDD